MQTPRKLSCSAFCLVVERNKTRTLDTLDKYLRRAKTLVAHIFPSRNNFLPLAFTSHFIVPLFSGGRRRYVPHPNGEVAEVFSLQPLECIMLYHRPEDGQDFGFRYGFYNSF